MQRAPLLVRPTQIYRDWHRAAKFMAEGNVRPMQAKKESAIRSIVRAQWKAKKESTDPQEIEELLEG